MEKAQIAKATNVTECLGTPNSCAKQYTMICLIPITLN